MSLLLSCSSCSGLIPGSGRCPNCGAAQARGSALRLMVRSVLALAGAGVAAITLMACYGMPPCDYHLPDGGPDTDRCYGNPGDHTDGGLPDGGNVDGGP